MRLPNLAWMDTLHERPAVLVELQSTQGSVPREAGAWMVVFADHSVGSIGGGALEWQCQQAAWALLQDPTRTEALVDVVLGPELGQCCGGRTVVRLRRISTADLPWLQGLESQRRASVAVFGAGHVGQALLRILETLPLDLRWLDSRSPAPQAAFAPAHLVPEYCATPARLVAELPAHCHVVVLTHSHALDLQIIEACLARQRQFVDLGWVGLIGSATKRAAFGSRLRALGYTDAEFERITCPLGLAAIPGKEPAVIAIATAAQLLQKIAETESAARTLRPV